MLAPVAWNGSTDPLTRNADPTLNRVWNAGLKKSPAGHSPVPKPKQTWSSQHNMSNPKKETTTVATPAPSVEPSSTDETGIVIFNPRQGLSKLPPGLQKALAKYRTREAVGVAPTWEPEVGEYLVGTISDIRDVTTKFGETVVVTFMTPDRGPLAVWLTADLKTKLQTAEKNQAYVITFDGWLTKKEKPSLMNDMKLFTVIEVLPD